MDLICRIFGHSWTYFFTGSDCFNERVDVRVCKCCGKTQHYKKIPTTLKGEYVWMNMVQYTKKGAQEYWDNKIKN